MASFKPRIVLVTGASSGIGAEIARVAAAQGASLVLVARRQERLEQLAAELKAAHGVEAYAVPLDLTAPGAARTLYDRVAALGLAVDMLVNNAGVGALGEFAAQEPERFEAMMALNMRVPVELTRLFLPGMVERGAGRVLNVASTSAFQAGPGMAVYHATKAFLVTFSEGVDYELRGRGVHVTTLCPRMTESEFFETASVKRSALLNRILADPRDVARAGYFGAIAGKSLVIPGLANKLMAYGSMWLPRRLATSIAARMLVHAH